MNAYPMPKINLQSISLSEYEADIARRIINGKTGELRASKPKTAEKVKVNDDSFFGYTYRYQTDEARRMGEAAYVWRMVCFLVSKNPQHQCMPCTADFDLDGSVKESRERAKELDSLVDRIVDSLPKSQHHGVTRWAQAFGMTGTPQYNEEGAIIYR